MKIVCLIVACLLVCSYAQADEGAGLSITDTVGNFIEKLKLEELKQGMAWDFVNNKDCYTFTKSVWSPDEFKDEEKTQKNIWSYLSIDIGYTSTDKFLVGGSVNLLKMSDHTSIPVLDLLRLDVGAWGGWGRIQIGGGMEANNEWAGGVNFCILKITK